MKKSFQILLSSFLVLFFIGCTKKNDLTKNTNSTEDSLSVYLSLANDISLSYESKQKYTQKALSVVEKKKNDSLTRANLFKIANRYFNMNDLESFKVISELVLNRAIIAKDSAYMAKAYTYLGDYYSNRMISDSAFRSYFKAQKIYLQINDQYNLAKTLISKASLQYNEADFFESEISVFKALEILKTKKDVNEQLYECYNLLGILSNEREEYNKAIDYQNKALKTLDDKSIPSDFQLKATSLNNIGFVYLRMKNYTQAISCFEKGLEEKNLFEEKTILYAMLLDNLAYSKLKSNRVDGLPAQFYRSLKIRDSLGLKMEMISNQIHLSEYYALKKDTAKAVEFSKQALLLSRSSDKLNNTLQALKQIAAVDPKNAAKYSKEYIQLNDKMLKAERNMGEKFSRIEYETNEIKDQNSSLQEKNKTLVYVFSICTLLGLFFYVYKTQQAKNRELLFKQQQQIANEDIYNLMISQQNEIELTRIKEKKRVAQELHDGILGRMFGIRISLDSLDKLDEIEAVPKRKKYLTELKNVEQDIREISHDLNREKSELINNFVSILNKLFEDQINTYSSKLITFFDPEIKWDLMSNIEKINLYRIVQEGLQNCNKYAEADIIRVEFKNENNNLVLRIEDDGIGFNTNRTKNGIGLHNIEYRVKECKGAVTIKSAKGEGTILSIEIPIDPNNNLHNDI
ncbi:tetratricopeptide repeat-containing sensor histidine kinase [Flavobacterium sp. UBA4854]|uniref:ATP-binding protein n=1 Tax=Flavobacterium sp. UBA4854 TaxID=1946548 RepID=UPI00257A04FB|nr:tetratricopeptide repeat-containing sensor histidine kinase [Flavobacterium sp. UBA4854]